MREDGSGETKPPWYAARSTNCSNVSPARHRRKFFVNCCTINSGMIGRETGHVPALAAEISVTPG